MVDGVLFFQRIRYINRNNLDSRRCDIRHYAIIIIMGKNVISDLTKKLSFGGSAQAFTGNMSQLDIRDVNLGQ